LGFNHASRRIEADIYAEVEVAPTRGQTVIIDKKVFIRIIGV